jgi:hypothetical protein
MEDRAAEADRTQESMKAMNATAQTHQNSMCMGKPWDGFCHASGRIVRRLPKDERKLNIASIKTVSQSPTRVLTQGIRRIMALEVPSEDSSHSIWGQQSDVELLTPQHTYYATSRISHHSM